MSVAAVQTPLFQAHAQALAVGLNAAGRVEVSPLFTTLSDRYPVFISDFQKRGRAGTLAPGQVWVWRESLPWLVGLCIRETPQGATRMRYVESALLNLRHNWQIEGLTSLALAPLAEGSDWRLMRDMIEYYLGPLELAVTVCEP
ncbi:MAG: hypothetical protein JW966_11830 [Anaerolineae bacterium]|nr:hypothetical protein [Anaerolineae bacterium]